MKRVLRATLPLIVALLAAQPNAKASHAMGGDLTYECVGQDSFLITLKFFRDCNGINAPGSVQVSAEAAGCYGSTVTITMPQVPQLSGIDITPLCPGQQSRCQNPSSLFPFGVQQYVYQAIIVLPANCNWTLYWSECCRNAAITTIVGSPDMFIKLKLDNSTVPCDNSPIFFNDPVPFTCVWQPTCYNHGVVDPEGDSLWFTLVDCLDDPGPNGVPVTYEPGHSATEPLSTVDGVTIDNRTGTLCFTPDKVQVGVLCVRVEEFRNNVKIGEVVRDIQYSVVDQCLNDFPVASGIDGSANYDTAICPGNLITFEVHSSDSNPFHSVTMSWNDGIPDATFTITGGQYPTGTFTWQTTAADIGTHFFTVTVQDDACPVIGTNIYSFLVDVRNPDIDAGPDLTSCDGMPVTPSVFASVDFTSWTWTPNIYIDDNTLKEPTFTPPVTTTYIVHGENASCESWDTITVFAGSAPSLTLGPDVSICDNETTQLSASGSAVSYHWEPEGSLTNPDVPNPTASPLVTTMYTVVATGADGCESTDSVLVTVNALPTVDAGLNQTMCEGQEVSLTASGAVTYVWEPGTLTGETITVSPGSTTSYTVTGTDANGCTGTDVTMVTVNPAPTSDAGIDVLIYEGETTILTGTPSAGAVSWQWSPDMFIVGGTVNDLSITVMPDQNTYYYFTVVGPNGCTAVDSVLVELDPNGLMFMPNAFSPNNDNENDVFYVVNLGPVQLEYFRIYNRWGQVVFEGAQAGQEGGWDGTYKGDDQPAGVYTYVVKSIDPQTSEATVTSGSVTLLR